MKTEVSVIPVIAVGGAGRRPCHPGSAPGWDAGLIIAARQMRDHPATAQMEHGRTSPDGNVRADRER